MASELAFAITLETIADQERVGIRHRGKVLLNPSLLERLVHDAFEVRTNPTGLRCQPLVALRRNVLFCANTPTHRSHSRSTDIICPMSTHRDQVVQTDIKDPRNPLQK